MKNEILIRSVVVPHAYCLGPMGDPNPSNFIIQETNQIPFKQSVVDVSSWNSKSFRNWPKMPKGWRNWFRRVLERKAKDWELSDPDQCLTLSLSRIKRNEPLLISASYFLVQCSECFYLWSWSNDNPWPIFTC
jgi:hypothetical protein